jgi:hypothetical protein
VRSTAWFGAAVLALVVPVSCASNGGVTRTQGPARSIATRVAGEDVVFPLFRQGVARDGSGWVFSFNDGLYRTDAAFAITRQVQPAIPSEWKARGFDHIGDIDVAKNVVYVPLEQPDYAMGRQAMLTYDATTLAYRSGIEIRQHENSFVTVDPSTRIAYSMDRFGGQALTRYDTSRQWKPLTPLRLSRRLERVQGADVRHGAVWLSTDDAADRVYRVDATSGALRTIGSIGHVDGEAEGIDATPTRLGDLHVLSIDAKGVPVRLIELAVTTSRRR